MKVRSKTTYTASLYKAGMEDGFVEMFHSPDNPRLLWTAKDSEEDVSAQVPYILASHRYYISEGDWILKGSDGSKIVINDEDFNGMFEDVNCKCSKTEFKINCGMDDCK